MGWLFRLCAVLPGFAAKHIDIIGYYGNSGNAIASIPKIADVHPNYNVIILTFASIDSSGTFSLDIQGPYEKDLPGLGADIKAWKGTQDKWGRQKLALVSIGGQNGHWPSSVSAGAIEAGLDAFMAQYNLDGLDIDLEGGAVAAASSLVPVIKSLTSRGKVVTAAPEASQSPLDAYKGILSELTWVHPQFYNNGPNSITTPWVPDATLWPTPWTVTDWQQETSGHSFWGDVIGQIGKETGLSQSQLGMLLPATRAAAGSYNNWDVNKLVREVSAAGVTHVGTWAIAYDNTQNWKLAEALGAINGEAAVIV